MKNQKNKNLGIEQKVMHKIRSGKIKLRSKYIFLAQKMGLNSALGLTIILAILFCNLVFFYLKTTDNLMYLSFGKNGILAFLESFPYLLTVMIIIFWLGAGYLATKTDWSYSKSFKCVILLLLILILLSGSILASTQFSQKIEEQAFLHQGPGLFFKPFLSRGVKEREWGLVGEISEINKEYLIVNSPQGNQYLNIKEIPSLDFKLQEGQLIIAVGKRKGDIFIAQKIRLIKNDDCPMINRGIHFYPQRNSEFSPNLENHFSRPRREVQECLRKCSQSQGFSQSCFEHCRPK